MLYLNTTFAAELFVTGSMLGGFGTGGGGLGRRGHFGGGRRGGGGMHGGGGCRARFDHSVGAQPRPQHAAQWISAARCSQTWRTRRPSRPTAPSSLTSWMNKTDCTNDHTHDQHKTIQIHPKTSIYIVTDIFLEIHIYISDVVYPLPKKKRWAESMIRHMATWARL